MRNLLLSLVMFAVSVPAAFAGKAADAPVSDATIHELLTVTSMRGVLDQAAGQFDRMMKNTMQQASAGQTLNAEQQRLLEEMGTRMASAMKDSLNWDSLEPLFINIYRTTFTQGEVDGMLKFYKTPAGKAVISKLPVVMQNSMGVMQDHMKDLVPRLQQIGREYAEKLQAARTPDAPAEPSNP